MNKHGSILAALGLLMISTCAFAQTDHFERALNGCMARPGASVIDCARIAATVVERGDTVRVSEEFATGEKPGASDRLVTVCDSDNAEGSPLCAMYDCNEDQEQQQSICEFIGSCWIIDGDLQGCG